MSGHSKWHSIRHKKAAIDAKRGKLFTQLIREMTVAARVGGGDPESNPRLRTAVQAAKGVNMPADNIKKAILKGTGELEGQSFEEVAYEGYGPGGVAILVETLTDNRNRTAPEMRHTFAKHGGNLGETGCVSWMFERKGYIRVAKKDVSEDAVLEAALEAGASDMTEESETFDVTTPFESFESVRSSLEAKGFPIESAEIANFPQTYVKLEGKQAEQALRLVELLEEHDDVQNVWVNFDIDEGSAA